MTRPSLHSLLERVRSAEKGSDLLDAQIRCCLWAPYDAVIEQSRINGKFCIYVPTASGGVKWWERPRSVPQDLWLGSYSTSLDAAVSLIEKELPGWAWEVGMNHGDGSQATLLRDGDGPDDYAVIEERLPAPPAISLLAALLSAKLSMEEDNAEA